VARERTGAWSASGQAELENRIVLLRVELEIYAGGGGGRRGCVFINFGLPPPPPLPPPPQIG
jgi:hypothetical protein